ncbi:MAG: pentapeptide repeat-containing protein [Myxococcaceae bacterium]|nr:pentapeptide repeat-containing protein [Myxococcaceae bacterium]
MAKAPSIEKLLASGSAEWNKARKAGKIGTDHTGATFAQLFSANADLSGLELVGTEWERCDLTRVTFRDSDLSNAYFHGGRLQDCDFRGANLQGATFERMKILRCDFSGAKGLEDLEMEDVDLDRVVGLNGEAAPPPPPPPAHGVTSFTREQRIHQEASQQAQAEQAAANLPPFRPQDSAGTLLFRGLTGLKAPPTWVLDVPGLRPPLGAQTTPGASLESLYREAVRARLEARTIPVDPEAVRRAQHALQMGSREAPPAAMYLKEVAQDPLFRFSAAKVLEEMLRAELDVDDLTGAVDPRVTGALLYLQLPNEGVEHLGEVRRRLAAAQLFSALLEAGFTPEHNWEEALESQDAAMDLAQLATGGDRAALSEAFSAFAALPEEARLRRLAYLAESASNLEQLARLPEGTEPRWITGPEMRECHEREMQFVQALSAQQIPEKVPDLAKSELGVEPGQVPEDSDGDLFIHFRCEVCGKEKLVVQTPDELLATGES